MISLLANRLIACFDIKNGRLTKAQQFQDNIDVGDPSSVAERLYTDQIDEIVFYDIMASVEQRVPELETIRAVAERTLVPLTVGGGLRSVDDMHLVLDAGAEKVSVDSMAVRDPSILTAGAREFGSQCIVLSMQVKASPSDPAFPSGYSVWIDGARTATGLDAVEWARRGEELGAGEIVVNSIDRDGTGIGFELAVTGAIASAVNLPVIASGGAGNASHIVAAFESGATAAIVSSMLYSPRVENQTVRALKESLRDMPNANIRPWVR